METTEQPVPRKSEVGTILTGLESTIGMVLVGVW